MKQILKLGLITLLVALVSCKKKKEEVETPSINFDKNILVNYWESELISPRLDTAKKKFRLLESSIEGLGVANTSLSLMDAKEKWKQAINSWKKLELMDIDVFKTQYIVAPHKNIDTWPINVPFLTRGLYQEGVTVNKEYVSNRGTTSKGLHGIEYLLYDYGSEQIALDSLNNTRRYDYLYSIAKVNIDELNILQRDWVSYQSIFKNNPDKTLQLVLNEMVSELEFSKKNRLAIPLGLLNGGFPKGEDVESPLSKTSLNQLLATIETSKLYFVCNESTGLDNYLNEVERVDGLTKTEPLATIVTNQYNLVIDQIKQMKSTSNLYDEVASQNAKNLHTNVERLLRLIKVDVSNNLGVTIFFSDNDGD